VRTSLAVTFADIASQLSVAIVQGGFATEKVRLEHQRGANAMASNQQSRREILKTAAALTAAASVGTTVRRAVAQGRAGATKLHARIDAALRRAVEAKEVPGVVAVAATDKGLLYEGAFGTRDLAKGSDMTPDTIFRLPSMTKAVTSVAAMQIVEHGKLQLEQPISDFFPQLAPPQALEGFDDRGAPRLRPLKQPITLRHLLTHDTARFGYEIWDPPARVLACGWAGPPAADRIRSLGRSGDDRWEYGINLDWVGRMVEAVSRQPLDAYFREHIFAPLGMTDTGFALFPARRSRLVSAHQRRPDGSLEPIPVADPPSREFWSGGGGLYSTVRDYLAFLQMLLHQGRFDGARSLRPETVALMGPNQFGNITAGILKTAIPERSTDLDFFPGIPGNSGLGCTISMQPSPSGRRGKTVPWAGIYDAYYWIDQKRRVLGLILTQMLASADHPAMRLYREFERGVYDSLKAA
jgi:methyl acetate hydrolase